MDNKTVFVRTSKGEDEVHSRTMHLPGDIKRALLMVDGSATYGEISKRAAPSLRLGLEAMLQELEKDGFITDKAKAGNIPRMSVPPKMVTPHKTQPADEGAGDLDFMSGFVASSTNVPGSGPGEAVADTGKMKAAGEARAKQEAETAKLKARQEAEAILHKAEQEASRIREEAEREKQRAAAEIHAREEAARRAKEEAEATRLKIEQAAKARIEAEARALQKAEAARKKAEQEAAILHETAERLARQEREAAKSREEAARRAKEEAEAARLKVEHAVKARLEAEAKALQQVEAARKNAEKEAAHETMEHLARQEKQPRKESEAKTTEAPAATTPDTFAFDAFQIGEPQPSATQQKVDQPANNAIPSGSGSATKADTFAFGAFHVDEPQPLVKPHKDEQPVQKPSPTAPAHAAKRETFSFDTFKIEIPEPPVDRPTRENEHPALQQGDVARPTQHAETGQPVLKETLPTAASKSVGGPPSQEEIKRATQERIETEKRMEEEALAAKKQAEAQAKAHAEAEQRKAEAARAEIERAAKQVNLSLDTSHVAHAVKSAPVARVRRKPFSLGRLVGFMVKLGMFLLALLAGALFVVPYVLPTRDYMPAVEKLLSEKLHQPVHIGYLSGRILPMPRLELGEIYFGQAKQFQVDHALINFALTGLMIEAKPIDSIELQGVKVYGAALENVSSWLQQLAADNQYPVARMVISRGTLDADVVKFTGVEGTLDFDKFGEFTRANLRSNDGKYMLDINAALGNKLQVAISLRDTALPLLPNWSFDDLTAKGLLSKTDLSISEFEGRIGGGVLKGNASIDWHSGWRAQGSMMANTISMRRLNNLLEGNVEGSARFKMTSVDLAGLAGSAVLEGNFTSKNGLISGMDIVETARLRSREHLPGGRTRFDELSGMFKYADNALHFEQIEVATDVLNGVATLDLDKQQISGSINAKLTLKDATKQVELQIGGVTDTPTLRYAP